MSGGIAAKQSVNGAAHHVGDRNAVLLGEDPQTVPLKLREADRDGGAELPALRPAARTGRESWSIMPDIQQQVFGRSAESAVRSR